MAENRKSIIDKALLEAEEIDKAFEANSKEILARTMGSEIEEMVKESLEGSMALSEDDDDVELEVSDEVGIDTDMDGDVDLALDLDDIDDIELGDNEDDLDIDLDMDVDDEDLDMDDEVETIDLTGADDMDVITVFKKMGPEDEIEVVQDGGNIDIKDMETGAEYRVELGGGADDMDLDADMDMDMGDLDLDMDMDMDYDDDMEDMSEEVIYEIEITEEDDEEMDDDMLEGDYMDDMEEEDNMEEGSRINSLKRGREAAHRTGTDADKDRRNIRNESRSLGNSKLIKENKVLKNEYNKIVSENEELKADYNKLVEALKQFRTKLNEVAVFNSNLTYAVRLFTEHSTTKEEKVDIIKRFDEAKSIKESKAVYKQLEKEVSKVVPIKESIDEKINETKGSGSKTEISESKVYVHPELEKMKKLWNFDYKY